MLRFLLTGLLVLLCTPAGAMQTPKGLATDARIKVVPYDANNVVDIHTAYGYVTTIVLEKGEYVALDGGIGKKAGWDVVSKPHSNLIVIKPLLADNATNLNFKTNKNRLYSLALHAKEHTRNPAFLVRFEYPSLFGNSPFAARNEMYAGLDSFGDPTLLNEDYSFKGDTTIAPVKAMDNGTFTLLKFQKGRPVPAILAVDPATRRESLVNFRVQGEFVVVEGVYMQMTLRYGAHVTCLFNDRALAGWYAGKPGVARISPRVVLAKPEATQPMPRGGK